MRNLYERKVVAKEANDNAETNFKVAKAAVENATENYNLVKQGPRKEDIDDARAQMEQAARPEADGDTAQLHGSLCPFSGVVLVKSAEIGEVVNPGTPVVTLADVENVWLKPIFRRPISAR